MNEKERNPDNVVKSVGIANKCAPSKITHTNISTIVLNNWGANVRIHSSTVIGIEKFNEQTEAHQPVSDRHSHQHNFKFLDHDGTTGRRTLGPPTEDVEGQRLDVKQGEPNSNLITAGEQLETTIREKDPKSENSSRTNTFPDAPPLLENQSESLESGTSQGPRRTTKSKSGRILISPSMVHSSQKDKPSVSDTSSKSVRPDRRRSSIEWAKRVSINTPQRRNSEHEVSWIDSNDVEPTTNSTASDEDFEVDSRPSIVVNMDSEKGRKISFSLNKLEIEIPDYLAEIAEENESVQPPSASSK